MIKELVSGIAAAFIFLLLLFQGAFWWLSLALAIGSYVGIRLLFPPEHRKVLAELPDGVSQEEFRQYLSQCRLALSLVYEDAAAVNNLSFKKTVLHLCELGDDLLINFEKDPQDMQVAQALPDRLQRLHEILVGYIDLANQKTHSPQSARALEATEKAVTKAVAKFEEMHHRLLENDAIDLSTNARTFDNLLDFD
ncbi:MAG: 5-bromo-4-chloroindolyl phosphate hydrolysis protein [Candidatus Electronema aureum]|uniref:5-bromo-4-chloroindolyl phosphate hydrolysis protein n=1 Tax=Candidatus Electronema aureum TaxID=2005002 RepID=A0A521G0K0_9BACT|nr:MAG: 5-bromo-4-chloroindolyl phosphate hydrolysis protein [Candidatus Electronema aureum]